AVRFLVSYACQDFKRITLPALGTKSWILALIPPTLKILPLFYSDSCYGLFPPLEITSVVDVVVV
ncbi:unnamed protein product, partial [Ixodes pacificus]